VLIRIDPEEMPSIAREMKAQMLQISGREAAAGWHFLTGE
jgi:hypothetical protein